MSAVLESVNDPRTHFRTDHYLRINQRRLEHLATLGLDLQGKRVLELGAGIGDLTSFFLDRECTVTAVEGRVENLRVLEERFVDEQRVDTRLANLDELPDWNETWDVVFAYGVLYHLSQPAETIAWMGERCGELLLLSTCVTPGDDEEIHPTHEDASALSQALDGAGCRPTRAWVHARLSEALPHVYCTVTQPSHDEFPQDWSDVSPSATGLHRAVFIASHTLLDDNASLSPGLLERHSLTARVS